MNKLCLLNEVVSSYILKTITMNYVNLLSKFFLKHNLSHPKIIITQNSHKDSNIILNVYGSTLSNPDVSDFGGLIRNADGIWVHNIKGNIWFFQYPS